MPSASGFWVVCFLQHSWVFSSSRPSLLLLSGYQTVKNERRQRDIRAEMISLSPPGCYPHLGGRRMWLRMVPIYSEYSIGHLGQRDMKSIHTVAPLALLLLDRKSTRLNSSH